MAIVAYGVGRRCARFGFAVWRAKREQRDELRAMATTLEVMAGFVRMVAGAGERATARQSPA